MDEDLLNDAKVARQTVAQLQILAIEHGKRLAQIERHVRDVKYGVVLLLVCFAALAYQMMKI